MSALLHPSLGFGIGLRTQHYEALLDQRANLDWLEVLTDNYLVPGGKPLHFLGRIREQYPIALHGVALSIGSTDALDREYLRQVKALARGCDAAWISDHLCWTGIAGRNTHDLLPLPYTEEALRHVVERVRMAQDILERRIVLENVSSYVSFKSSTLSESGFLRAVAQEADCLILLDVNNVYVSSVNHGLDALAYLDAMPADRVQQVHLAGHDDRGPCLVDTHDRPVPAPVWDLYVAAVRRFGAISTSLERDADIPPLGDLVAELDAARSLARSALSCAA
ncbi:MAG TPA: DUF692 domain-containing protein [Steroidobacteraceae bacterium]|jgi:hypothetical protein